MFFRYEIEVARGLKPFTLDMFVCHNYFWLFRDRRHTCRSKRFTLNSARTFRRPSFQRTQLGAANHSAYSNRRHRIQRLHISATFISANTTRRFQTQRLLKLS